MKQWLLMVCVWVFIAVTVQAAKFVDPAVPCIGCRKEQTDGNLFYIFNDSAGQIPVLDVDIVRRVATQ